MTERPLSPHCKIFVDRLEEGISPKHVRVNNLGTNEGCVIDILDPATLEGTSIKIDEKGRLFGEIMVPHCKTTGTGEMYLVTVGMELCGGDRSKGIKGCEIDQVHIHAYGPSSELAAKALVPKAPVFGSTHVHFDCQDLDRHPSQKRCIEKLAEAIVKLERYKLKICT